MSSHRSPITSHKTSRALLAEGIGLLHGADVPSAALAAEILLMHALGRDRAWIYAHPEEQIESATHEKFLSLIALRAKGVPTQHLTGHQEFWGLDFEVTPDVLIPRPETEHVIEVALARLGVADEAGSPRRGEKLRIADVGTGSGCIAVALAKELPFAQIVATDISAAALEVARRNAERHAVASRIHFAQCNLLEAFLHGSQPQLTDHESRRFDIVASNPPYIGRHEAATLPREVRDHEPEAALYGGEVGTEIYSPLIEQAARLLPQDGIIVLELGHASAGHVLRLLSAPEWTSATLTSDLAGISRVASARRTRLTQAGSLFA